MICCFVHNLPFGNKLLLIPAQSKKNEQPVARSAVDCLQRQSFKAIFFLTNNQFRADRGEET